MKISLLLEFMENLLQIDFRTCLNTEGRWLEAVFM